MRPPVVRLFDDELVVDCFAGGGGASTGIEWALGRSPTAAINHDPEAVAMHAANHPRTRHLCGDIFHVKPAEVCGTRRPALVWFSPDCTWHSKARGGKPFRDPKEARGRRGLAWVVIRWARQVQPRVIMLENVEEFEDWAPLDPETGKPDKARLGLVFRIWLGKLRAAGYHVEYRQLRACDYGAPTSRRRLFLIARSDGEPIVWPRPTHGPGLPDCWASAASCMDWSIPAPSIFTRKRPLADNTLARIARGMQRFVLETGDPFVIPTTHPKDQRVHDIGEPLRTITSAHRGELALVAPTMYQSGYGERPGQAPRSLDIQEPIGTLMAEGVKHALALAFLAKHYGGPRNERAAGLSLSLPFGTVTTVDHHALVSTAALPPGVASADRREQVRAFITTYYGTSTGQPLQLPLGTVTAGAQHFGLVKVRGEAYEIADIGMRMLVPRELYRAQGFPDSYRIDIEHAGKPLTQEAQVRMVGNSVVPHLAAALVRANVGAQRRVAA